MIKSKFTLVQSQFWIFHFYTEIDQVEHILLLIYLTSRSAFQTTQFKEQYPMHIQLFTRTKKNTSHEIRRDHIMKIRLLGQRSEISADLDNHPEAYHERRSIFQRFQPMHPA